MKKTIKGLASILLLSAFLVACAEGDGEQPPPPTQDAPAEQPVEETPPNDDM